MSRTQFKSVKDLPPDRFIEEFIRDLTEAKSLDRIRWIFDGKKLPGGITNDQKLSMLRTLSRMEQQLGPDVVRKFGDNFQSLMENIANSFDEIFLVK